LLETLNSVLMNLDSPARNESRTPRPVRVLLTLSSEIAPSTAGRTSRNAPHNARVNQVGVRSSDLAGTSGTGRGGGSSVVNDRTESKEHHDYDNGTLGNDTPQPFMNHDEAFVNLLQIDVRDCEEAPNKLLTFDVHHWAAHAILENPNVACMQHCSICRGTHHFKDCTTLNDHDFLKQHYIRFC